MKLFFLVTFFGLAALANGMSVQNSTSPQTTKKFYRESIDEATVWLNDQYTKDQTIKLQPDLFPAKLIEVFGANVCY